MKEKPEVLLTQDEIQKVLGLSEIVKHPRDENTAANIELNVPILGYSPLFLPATKWVK